MRGKKSSEASRAAAAPTLLLSPPPKAATKRATALALDSSSDEEEELVAIQNERLAKAGKKSKSTSAASASAGESQQGGMSSRAATPLLGTPKASESFPVTRRLLEMEDDWQMYTPPPAPLLPSLEEANLENVAERMIMNPRALHGYRLSDNSNKYVVLAGYGNGANLQIREFLLGNNTTLYPDNRKMVKLDSIMTANLVYLATKKIRDVMHDDGPAVGEEKYPFGRLLYGTLNPEFGPHLDIRHFFFPKDPRSEALPTRRGIRLSKDEFDTALLAIQAIKPDWPSFDQAASCIEEHCQEESQGAEELCPYCSPPRP